MKTMLTFLVVLFLNGAFLYPLFFLGTGRPVSWLLVTAMVGSGVGCFYLLVKYRKQL